MSAGDVEGFAIDPGKVRAWKRYPAYKDSGVEWLGEVPAGWEVKRLKYLCQINPSKSEVASLPESTKVSFLPMELIGEDCSLTLTENRPISDVWEGYTYFRNGDVIVAKITPCFENGKGALVDNLVNGIAFGTTELHVLRAGEKIDPKFLFLATKSYQFRRLGADLMTGTAGQKRVPDAFIRDYIVGLPPLPEQHAITAFLDRETARIDALIAKKQRFIELLEEKRQAIISHAVTKGLGPNVEMKDSRVEWLGMVPAEWEVLPLSARYQVQLGKMLDKKQISGDYLAPYLRNTNVQWGKVDLSDLYEMDFDPSEREYYSLKRGDLLVCEGGEIGRTAIWNEELSGCYYQKAVHRVRALSQKDTSRYLYYAMFAAAKIGVFDAGADVSTISHLTAIKLKKLRFPFPPYSEQLKIVDYLDSIVSYHKKITENTKMSIEKLREYRTALISAAVTGKIDVRGEAPAAP